MTTKLETPFQTYSIFGVYEGCADRYASAVAARNPMEALASAAAEWQEDNEDADVQVRFCGVVTGNHLPLDDAYARPGWRRDELVKEFREATGDQERQAAQLSKFTVITTDGAHHVFANNALDAELAFNPEEVAAVLAGHVVNEFSVFSSDVKPMEKGPGEAARPSFDERRVQAHLQTISTRCAFRQSS